MKLTEERIRRAVKSADRRYYDMIAQQIAARRTAASRKGRLTMKNIRKIGKYVFAGVLAAAVLCGGGIAATVAMRGRENVNIFERSSSQTESSIVTEQKAGEKPVLHLTEDDSKRMPMSSLLQRFWLTETDKGYYWCRADEDNRRSFYSYLDKESGESVPLCIRPNCLHDGSEFCTASTEAYGKEQLFAYGGKLWTISTAKTDGHPHAAVLCYEPDGSSITRIADFSFPYDAYTNSLLAEIQFRGYLFALIEIDVPIQADALFDAGNLMRGYALVCYELAAGKADFLWTSEPDPAHPSPREDPSMLWGSGDAVYFGGPKINKGCAVYEINLHTPEIKKIISDIPDCIVPARDGVYYVTHDMNGSALMRYDYQTGGETRLNRTAMSGDIDWTSGFAADDRYFYSFSRKPLTAEEMEQAPGSVFGCRLHISDHDCQPAAEIDIDEWSTAFPYSIVCSDNEYFYMKWDEPAENGSETEYLIRTKIDALIADGTPPAEWERLLILSGRTVN